MPCRGYSYHKIWEISIAQHFTFKDMDDAEIAEKNFKEFDWSKSKEWLAYYQNLYPTPPLEKLEKYKRNWYRRHVNKALLELPKSDQHKAQKPTDQSASTPTKGCPNSKQAPPKPQQSTPRPPLEFCLLLTFFVCGAVIFMNCLVAVIPSVQYEKLLWLCLFSIWAALIIGACRCSGWPQINMDYVRRIAVNTSVQYICYMIAFSSIPIKAPFILPVAIAAADLILDLYSTNRHQLERLGRFVV
ncbi:hypothetical protein BdWA1_003098 [Babesia duncani]|uniref:Uncharacterized protein n=1 Tax=Babesia duncani TaxID=323732 RepID=A0AAD9PJ44_9APIC|nr:hypothetical protein BdWA1_003098 [Babesia duncani]